MLRGPGSREGIASWSRPWPRGPARLRPQQTVDGARRRKAHLKPKTWKAHSEKGTFTTDPLLPEGSVLAGGAGGVAGG